VRTVLLDLDGTLADSLPGITAATNAALGTSLSAEEVRPRVGPPLHETFAALTGATGEELDEAVARYRAIYAELMLEGTVVFDGIPELLAQLRDAGLLLAVATSKARPLAVPPLEGLGLAGFFAAIEGPVPGGPAAHHHTRATIGVALDALGRPPVATVTMVGDRHHDVEGAHAHGIRAVGVTWGFGSREELRGADALAATPAALGALLLDGPP
jgi:phosphoglycolate phosphatase